MQKRSGRQQANQSRDDTENTFLLDHPNNTYKEKQQRSLKSTAGTNTQTVTHTKYSTNFHRFFPCPAGPPPPAAHILPPPAGTDTAPSSSLTSSCSTSPPSESQEAGSVRYDLHPDLDLPNTTITDMSHLPNGMSSSLAVNNTCGAINSGGGYPRHSGEDHNNNTKQQSRHQQQDQRQIHQLQSGLNCSAATTTTTTQQLLATIAPSAAAVHERETRVWLGKHSKGGADMKQSPPRERSYSPSPRPPSPLRGQTYAANKTKPLARVSTHHTGDEQETVDIGGGGGGAIRHNQEPRDFAGASTTAAMVLIDPTTSTYKKFNAKVENITTLVLSPTASSSSFDKVKGLEVRRRGESEKGRDEQNGRTMRGGGHVTRGRNMMFLANDNSYDDDDDDDDDDGKQSSIKNNGDFLEVVERRNMLVGLGLTEGKEKRERGNHYDDYDADYADADYDDVNTKQKEGPSDGYGYSDRGSNAHSPAGLSIIPKERDDTAKKENMHTHETKEEELVVVVQMRAEISALKYQIDLLQKHLEEAVAVAEGQQQEIERAAAEKEELQSAHKEEVWLLKREHEAVVDGLKSRLAKVEGAAERQHDHVIELTAMIKRLQVAANDERRESEGLRDQLHAERRSNAQLAMYVATLDKKAAETRAEVCEWKRKERAAMLEERRQYEAKANEALTKALLIGNTIT